METSNFTPQKISSSQTKPQDRVQNKASVVRRVQVAPAETLAFLRKAPDHTALATRSETLGKTVWQLSGRHDSAKPTDYSSVNRECKHGPDEERQIGHTSRATSPRNIIYIAPPKINKQIEIRRDRYDGSARQLTALPDTTQARLREAMALNRVLKTSRPKVLAEILDNEAKAHERAKDYASTTSFESWGRALGAIVAIKHSGLSLSSVGYLLGFALGIPGTLRKPPAAPGTLSDAMRDANLVKLGIFATMLTAASCFKIGQDKDSLGELTPLLWMLGMCTTLVIYGNAYRDNRNIVNGRMALEELDRQVESLEALRDEMSFVSGRLHFRLADIDAESATFDVDVVQRGARKNT